MNGIFAQCFNRRPGRTGHLFQGRFKSDLVEKDTYLLFVSRYIVLNPVRANIVPGPSNWAWSSYRAQAGQVPPPSFLTIDWLLGHFNTNDRYVAQAAYRKFVSLGLEDTERILDGKPIFGSKTFVAEFRDTLNASAPLRETLRIQRFAARPSLREIFEGCSGRQDRNARVRTAHITNGYTMREIADHLGLHPMTISRVVGAGRR